MLGKGKESMEVVLREEAAQPQSTGKAKVGSSPRVAKEQTGGMRASTSSLQSKGDLDRKSFLRHKQKEAASQCCQKGYKRPQQ